MAYVTNYCPNPSFEVSLTGYSALAGTVLSQDATYVKMGQQAMKVVTDGSVPAEGFYGPVVQVTGTSAQCSVSLSMFSTTGGTVSLSAVNGSGQVVGSASVALTNGWQRVQVSGFTIAAGGSFYLIVQTATAQALTFWVDACQMEIGVTTASVYIDGDQNGCSWSGARGLSASTLPYQNTETASGGMLLSGDAKPVQSGQQFADSASGTMTLSGKASPSSAVPVAAFDDFALFGLGDPDPAMTYVDQNNAGTLSGHTTWAQNYGLFYPPQDYPVSGGKYAWRRAAYMALGYKFTGVAAGQEQNLSRAQVHLSPITGSAPVPNAYTSPRQIQTIIKPARLNYCTNPAFAGSAAGWSGVGTGTIAQDTTQAPTQAWLTMAQAQGLGAVYNNIVISDDSATGTGNFDGAGNSYSKQALASAGIQPGSVIASAGINYTFPNAGAGQPDCLQAVGQVVQVAGTPGATALGFLGASAGGGISGVSGTVTVTYTDGTTSTATLGFTDWTLASGASAVLFGNQVAATLPYRNTTSGVSSQVANYLFSQTIAVTPAKSVASITLPNAPGMHIFAVSLAQPTGLLAGTTSGKVTINASGDGAQISLSSLIFGDTYTASMYVLSGPGLSGITAQCSGGSVLLSQSTGGIPYGGAPGYGYGQGPYGGVNAGVAYSSGNYGAGIYGGNVNDLPLNTWFRLSFTFVANASTVTLQAYATSGGDVTYPANFWIAGVLVEPGTTLGTYFDGSYGAASYLDYQWEGTAGLSRSYYYPELAVKKQTITKILAKHTPLGISYAPPQYVVPYSQ